MECELCGCAANMYCQSDEAWLCYKCDVRVHSANFIVANHSRIPLCHHCNSLTPWKASGATLASDLFACRRCSIIPKEDEEEEEEEHDTDRSSDHEEEESQVVPWILKSQPSPATICSSIEDKAGAAFSLKKRFRAAAAPMCRFSMSPRGEGGILSPRPTREMIVVEVGKEQKF